MKTSKRKTRSDKFPLTLHPTGQYCKKINGKIHYFGSDKKQALQKYLDQATSLHGSHGSTELTVNSDMTLKKLCDLYLQYQHSKVMAGDWQVTLRQNRSESYIESVAHKSTFLSQYQG